MTISLHPESRIVQIGGSLQTAPMGVDRCGEDPQFVGHRLN
jgi:hypothetical protein